jgi:hypothetical protein
MASTNKTVRFPSEIVDLIAQELRLLQRDRPGEKVPWSTALFSLVRRGAEAGHGVQVGGSWRDKLGGSS